MPTKKIHAKISRRRFLQSAAAVGAAASVVRTLPLPAESIKSAAAYPENGTLVPDEGWHLWVDPKATWKDDVIFLPEDVTLDAQGVLHAAGAPLPINPPTGGWKALTDAAGKSIILPATVEQHFWGKFGLRPYDKTEYDYAVRDGVPIFPGDDNTAMNGAYVGVSWFYRSIDIPRVLAGKRIFLTVRGARLRAEVFLNEKLVGYSILEELPFECDLTHAAKPGGENHLAIRITNPGGRFEWQDTGAINWGKVQIFRSHGFGGLDRGLTLSFCDGIRIKSAWVLNKPDTGAITAFAEIESHDDNAKLLWEILDPTTGKVVLQSSHVQQNAAKANFADLVYPQAKLWDLDTPTLYHLRVTAKNSRGETDTRTVVFGFRWYTPTGIGTNAMLRLNGRRIRVYSAISWGFWGLNGMWPIPELAEKEVVSAKKIGLNCLNFHRNLAKEDVLRKHDELGLLRYMEPGGGKFAIAKIPPPDAPNGAAAQARNFAEAFLSRYALAKCLLMVRTFRSHPSVIEYCLQNEIVADLSNPNTVKTLQILHNEDPSRTILLNDGHANGVKKDAQAFIGPYSDKVHRSDQEPWGGWWDQHQGSSDQWYDEFYKSPIDFTYKAPFKEVIVQFGEMEACVPPDNHSLMVHQITETYKRYGGTSYDLLDHQEIAAGYEEFLTRWKFREAFPTSEFLFTSLAKKSYTAWMNYMENVRLSEEFDYAAISGWESTAIENHCGLVDNLRNCKNDPSLIAGSLLPVRPIAKQHAACIALGQSASFDLFLANDTPVAATDTLTFSMVTPSNKRVEMVTLPAPVQHPDQFTYLLKENFVTPPLNEEGLYRFRFAISSAPASTQTKELWVASTKLSSGKMLKVAVSGVTNELRKQLQDLGSVVVTDFKPGGQYDLIVSQGVTPGSSRNVRPPETTNAKGKQKATAPLVYTPEDLGHLDPAIVDAVNAGASLLVLAQNFRLCDGVAKQLAAAGAFSYTGSVGGDRALWMGNWHFVRKHMLYDGMPVDQAMGFFYQARGRGADGLLIDGTNVEVLVGYSRDHDRKVGAASFTAKLGKGKLVFHRVPDFQSVMQQRFLANALRWLTA